MRQHRSGANRRDAVADVIMLDNMGLADLRSAVALVEVERSPRRRGASRWIKSDRLPKRG